MKLSPGTGPFLTGWPPNADPLRIEDFAFPLTIFGFADRARSPSPCLLASHPQLLPIFHSS